MKPLSSEDDMPNESKSGFDSSTSSGPKYKYPEDPQKKMREADKSMKQLPKANEAFCLDMYKSAAPSLAAKKVDLFSGLSETVKVSLEINIEIML